MNTYTVSFFGHRVVENPLNIADKVEQLVRTLLREQEYVEFLVGRDGDFDQIASSAIRRCKRAVGEDNCAHVWVLPYLTAEFRENEAYFREYYDEIEVCPNSAAAHYKNAYQTRNRAMVDRSDLVVFCIQHASGGAWQTMKYARKQGIPYINIGDEEQDRGLIDNE